MSDIEGLWGPAEVARFLGYAESTVTRMASAEPEKLPPRVRAVAKPRWAPEVCRQWAMKRQKDSTKARRTAMASLPAALQDALLAPHRFPRGVSGIYFLMRRKAVVYVGRASDIGTRLGQHAKAKDFDGFAWHPCAATDAQAMERLCIAALDPPLNRDHTTTMDRRTRAFGCPSDG